MLGFRRRLPWCLIGIISIITSNCSTFISDARQLNHHLLGILLGYFEIRDGIKQVDMPHLLTATHKTVQRLHQFTRIESIALAQVNEQAAIAFLCFVLQFLLVALGLLLLFIGFHLFDLRCFGIVGQELTKL